MLEGCDECTEGAWLRTWEAFARMWGGDHGGAEPIFAGNVGVGERFGDLDLVTMSRLGQGMCLVLRGQGAAGIALLDEVVAGVTSGEVSPMYAGMAYCTVIGACSDLFDLRRAREWTAAFTRWCDAQPELVPYRGKLPGADRTAAVGLCASAGTRSQHRRRTVGNTVWANSIR